MTTTKKLPNSLYFANLKRLASIKLPSSLDGINKGIIVQRDFWREGRAVKKVTNEETWEYSTDTRIEDIIDVRMMKIK